MGGGLLRSYHAQLAFVVRLIDSGLITLALWVSVASNPHGWEARHTFAAALAVVLFYFVGEGLGLYRTWRTAPMKQEMFRLWGTWGIVVSGMLLVGFFSKVTEEYSRFVMSEWFVLAPMLLTGAHVAMRLFLQEIRARGRNTRTVAIVGVCPTGERIAREILATPWSGLRMVGFFDDRDPRPEPQTKMFGRHQDDAPRAQRRVQPLPDDVGPYVGDLDLLVEQARAGKIDIVYIALPMRAEGRIRELIVKLADTTATVHVVADLFLSDVMKGRWTSLGDLPVLSVFDTPFHGIDGWTKRVEDIVLGTIILGMIALPMAAIALAIKLTSRGPIFFRQRRYGLNGEEFWVLKFRTMTVMEDGSAVKQATKNDPRITRLGAFLRRTSLDELPQFLHVITGKMSIVGPRPHAIAHNELYRKQIRGYMLRHKVKPGITGWAQINGWRGETDTLEKMEKRIQHDLQYIQNWGLWLDLKIIFLTVFGTAVRKNAY